MYVMRFSWILAAMTLACTPVKDLSRVSSNYVDKAIFDGEWYHKGTIVDKNFGQAGTFIGSQSELERVRFKITKDYLIAYRSYEKAPGSEAANVGEQTWIAKFPISKHFDIRRRYNEQNGIEDNVIEENDKDRDWHERKYVRVDWSTNLINDAQFNDFLKTESVSSIVRNSYSKESYRARVSNNYIETTIDALARPDENVCAYIGDWNCDPSRVRIKYSFMKINGQSQYEKRAYPDYLPVFYGQNSKKELCLKGDEGCSNLKELWLNRTPTGSEICDPKRGHNPDDCEQYQVPVFSRFGFFRTERNRFDRESGFTLSGREQLINRWNIWEATRYEDGSPIPLAKREPKAVVYYLNATFPEDLFEASQKMADDWSTAFVGAVAAAKSMNKSDATEKYGKLFQIRMNDCNIHNLTSYIQEKELESDFKSLLPVEVGNLEEGCALAEWISEQRNLEPRFSWQELGDLRYSFLNYTTKAELSGPLGFGPSSTDPLTGEIIGANANIYGAALDVYAAFGADVVHLLNSQTSSQEIMNGSQIRAQIKEAKQRLAADLPAKAIADFEKLFDQRIASIPEGEYLKTVPISSIGSKLKVLKDSGFEDRYLMSDEVSRLFSLQYGLNLTGTRSDEGFERARPSNWAKALLPPFSSIFGQREADVLRARGLNQDAPSFLQEFEQREDFFAKRNACFMGDAIEPAVIDLASSLSGKSWQEAYLSIRQQIFRAVASHELGHTFGLRHNFEGSADPLNFFPSFWGVDTGDDRMSNASERPWELRYSSIMDYHQRFNSDFGGIGLYDKAAIKFGYAETIEIFDESKSDIVPRGWFANIDMFNYKDLPILYSGSNVDEKLDKHYDDVRARFRRGDESARIDLKSLQIKGRSENLFKRKDISFADYYRAAAARLFGMQTPIGEVFEVPYKFCSDAFASGGNITCNRWDMGATAEEIVDNAAQLYESYYVFNAYRGDKLQINPSSYMARLYSRTYQPMLSAFRYLYYYRRSSLRIWPLMQDWTNASYKGLNFFGRVLQTPEPGRYCLTDENLYVPESEAVTCLDPVEIGLSQGRFYNTSFSNEFFFKPNNIGHIYDKILAMRALTDSTGFITRDFSTAFNRNALSIGYYRVFAPEMIQLFTSIMRGDAYGYAPALSVDNGVAAVSYRPLVGSLQSNAKSSEIRIKPSESWSLRYYALAFPMIYYSSTVDNQLDYAERSRISIVGSSNDPVVDPALSQSVFTDPYTRLQYRSVAVESEEASPGYLLVKEAHDFVNDAKDNKALGPWRVAKDGLAKAKAELAVATAPDLAAKQGAFEKAKSDFQLYEGKLKDKIQMIKLVKHLGDLLEH